MTRARFIRMGAMLITGKTREAEMAEALQKLGRVLNSTMVTTVVKVRAWSRRKERGFGG